MCRPLCLPPQRHASPLQQKSCTLDYCKDSCQLPLSGLCERIGDTDKCDTRILQMFARVPCACQCMWRIVNGQSSSQRSAAAAQACAEWIAGVQQHCARLAERRSRQR